MHDGAPCHQSMSTKTYLENRKICYIPDWPPLSLDLNIIENMWYILKRNVFKRFPSTIDELWKATNEEWYRIDDSYIRNLYASIPKQLDAVIKRPPFQVLRYTNICICDQHFLFNACFEKLTFQCMERYAIYYFS